MSARVKVTPLGHYSVPHIDWPQGWPVPRVGDEVTVPGSPPNTVVRAIDWHPEGSRYDPQPFVYVVVGPRQR